MWVAYCVYNIPNSNKYTTHQYMNIYNTHDMPVQCTHAYMSVYDYNTTIQYKLPMYKHKPKHKQGIIVDVPGNIYVSAASQYQYLQLPSRSLFPSTSHYLASQYQNLQLPVPIRQHCRLSISSHFG